MENSRAASGGEVQGGSGRFGDIMLAGYGRPGSILVEVVMALPLAYFSRRMGGHDDLLDLVPCIGSTCFRLHKLPIFAN